MFTFKTVKVGKNIRSACWYGSLFMNVYVLRPDEFAIADQIKSKQLQLAKEKLKKLLPNA